MMISSLSNARVKYVRRLQSDRRFRQREQTFVVEGTRWMIELDQRPLPPKMLFYTADWLAAEDHKKLLSQNSATHYLVSDQVLAMMSDTETAPGVLAVVDWPQLQFPTQPSLLLILDGVSNPGNLGTMLRTAVAAGVDGVLLGPGCVDMSNPKVVRGGMGAHLRLPMAHLSWDEIKFLTADLAVWMAVVDGDVLYTAVDWRQPAALIIGSEAHGIGSEAGNLATGRLTIPLHNNTESLNAAVAGAVILFEAARQRRG